MDSDVVIVGYKVEVKSLNLYAKRCDPKYYELGVVAVYLAKIHESYIVARMGKATKKGTMFKYKLCTDEAEMNEYLEKTNKLMDDINNKYDGVSNE